jgi:hypothetical protein
MRHTPVGELPVVVNVRLFSPDMADAPFHRCDDPRRFVYHYTTRDVALAKILASSRLRISPFLSTNDPREAKEWEFDLVWEGNLKPPDLDEHSNIKQTATARAKNRVKLLCTSSDEPDTIKRDRFDLLARGCARPRMWAQYGENHSGICLVLTRDKLHGAILQQLHGNTSVHAGPVEYSNNAATDSGAFSLNYNRIVEIGLDAVLDEHLQAHHRHLFFEKGTDWAAEREYRWVLHSDVPGPEFVDRTGCVAGIIMGSEFPLVYQPSLRPLCVRHAALLAQMCWRNGQPGIIT